MSICIQCYSKCSVKIPCQCHDPNINEFKLILQEIKDFAILIGFDYYARKFDEAYHILTKTNFNTISYGQNFPNITGIHLQLLKAASIADVFGGMGSWNDSPPYIAHEKGMENEYNNLSNRLLEQIRLATLFAINEW